jgi:hypothetical protein
MVERTAGRYVAQLERLLPHILTLFYLVGSVALDVYRPGRSDLDSVAVVDRDLGRPSCAAFAFSTLVVPFTLA